MKSKKGTVYKRKQFILQTLKEQKSVNINQLAQQLNISPITVRRDLQNFEEKGIAERFYGGAKLVEGSLSEDPSQLSLSDVQLKSKHAIARKAAEMVEDGDAIFINTSSTALLMLEYLNDKHVTIITNNGSALMVHRAPGIELVLSGGEVSNNKNSLVGDFALQTFSKVWVNKCFVGVSGINAEGQISTSVLQEAAINELILNHSNVMRVILADSSKLGRLNNFIIRPTQKVTHIITDSGADPAILAQLQRDDLELCCVSPESVQK